MLPFVLCDSPLYFIRDSFNASANMKWIDSVSLWRRSFTRTQRSKKHESKELNQLKLRDTDTQTHKFAIDEYLPQAFSIFPRRIFREESTKCWIMFVRDKSCDDKTIATIKCNFPFNTEKLSKRHAHIDYLYFFWCWTCTWVERVRSTRKFHNRRFTLFTNLATNWITFHTIYQEGNGERSQALCTLQ